jgi:hypothetical protein
MENKPIKTIPIHEHLRPRLCDTYENDSIFDKFEVVFSGDGQNVMTGSYNNNFMIYPTDPDKEIEVVLQADKSAFKAKKVGVPTPINGKKQGSRAGSPAAGGPGARMRKETDADQIDFNKKILHMSWHPFEDSIAIAATNNVSFVSTKMCGEVMKGLTWDVTTVVCVFGVVDWIIGITVVSPSLTQSSFLVRSVVCCFFLRHACLRITSHACWEIFFHFFFVWEGEWGRNHCAYFFFPLWGFQLVRFLSRYGIKIHTRFRAGWFCDDCLCWFFVFFVSTFYFGWSVISV